MLFRDCHLSILPPGSGHLKWSCIFKDNPIMMMNIMNRNCQGLDTALKCCYEDIEDTLTVPPEVRKHQISKTWAVVIVFGFHKFEDCIGPRNDILRQLLVTREISSSSSFHILNTIVSCQPTGIAINTPTKNVELKLYLGVGNISALHA